MKSKNSAISVKDVTKIYRLYEKPIDRLKEAMSITHKNFHRDFYALNGISFDVNKGETVGIIGTNGSGKSTILKIITGVLTPTTGEVEVDGVISALLELGAGFNMDYTGIENIFMNGTMMGFSRKEMEAKLQDILGAYKKFLSSLSHLKVFGSADDQPGMQLLFQILQMNTDGRLRNPQGLCSCCKIFIFYNGNV